VGGARGFDGAVPDEGPVDCEPEPAADVDVVDGFVVVVGFDAVEDGVEEPLRGTVGVV
jgi:hypothetical protein